MKPDRLLWAASVTCKRPAAATTRMWKIQTQHQSKEIPEGGHDNMQQKRHVISYLHGTECGRTLMYRATASLACPRRSRTPPAAAHSPTASRAAAARS